MKIQRVVSLTRHVQADFTKKVVCFEAIVIPDGEFKCLTGKLLASEVHEDQRLMPLRVTGALDVTRTTLVVRAAQTPINVRILTRGVYPYLPMATNDKCAMVNFFMGGG